MLFVFSSFRTFGSFNNISYEVFFTEYSENSPMHERFTNFQSILKLNQSATLDFDSDVENNSSGSENSISDLSPEIDEVIYENVNQFWIFTLADGRLYSRETNIDYRLQIWQDVLFDLDFQDKILTGYAYNEIIPAMTPRERQGWDGSNENVHNYLVNIFARGGLIQLVFFWFYIFT